MEESSKYNASTTSHYEYKRLTKFSMLWLQNKLSLEFYNRQWLLFKMRKTDTERKSMNNADEMDTAEYRLGYYSTS